MNETKVVTRTPQAQLKVFLSKDAELKYTPNGLAVLEMNFALSADKRSKEQFGDKAKATWVTAKVFGEYAEAVAKLEPKKGQLLALAGDFQTRTFEHNGETRQTLEFVANDVALVATRAKNGSAGKSTSDDFPADLPF